MATVSVLVFDGLGFGDRLLWSQHVAAQLAHVGGHVPERERGVTVSSGVQGKDTSREEEGGGERERGGDHHVPVTAAHLHERVAQALHDAEDL